VPEYSGGTVWLQVAPSFLGVQESIRSEVAGAMRGVEKEVDRSTDRMASSLEKGGKKGAEKFANSFEALTRQRLKRIQKDLANLGDLPGVSKKEYAGLLRSAEELQKANLQTNKGQEDFIANLRHAQGEMKRIFDEAESGQRQLGVATRNALGAINAPMREIDAAFSKWRKNVSDADVQKQIAAWHRMQKEMASGLDAPSQQTKNAELQLSVARTLAAFNAQQAKAREKEQAAAAAAETARHKEQLQLVQNRAKIEREAASAKAASDRQGAAAAREQMALVRNRVKLEKANNKAVIKSEMDAIQNEIRNLSADIKLNPEIDLAAVEGQIAALRSRLAATERNGIDLKVDVDTTQAMIQLRMLEAQARRSADGVTAMGRVMRALDAGSAANSVRVFNGVLFSLLAFGPALIPVLAGIGAGIFGVGAAALGAFAGIGILLASFTGIGDAVSAMNELDKQKRLERAGGGANNAGADALAAQRRAVQDARSISDAQRSLARARRDAAAQIEQADRRVADAERGLSDAHAQAADMVEDAGRRVNDALERLSDTRKANADAAADAALRVVDAERSVQEAQAAATRAQLTLNEARQQAVRDLQDMNNQLDSARLAEREGVFAVEEAAAHLNAVLEDDQSSSREKAKAQLAYDQAVEGLEQQRLETQRLEKDTAKANKAGVEGSETVKDAKQGIADANETVKEAEKDLADARVEQRDVAVRAEEALADAKRDVSDAVEERSQAEVDAARVVDDAEIALADARAERADAAVLAQEGVSNAARNLNRAYEDQALAAKEAAVQTGAVATATNNLNEALIGMNPAALAFATWLYSLKPLLDDLVDAIQTGFLPGLQAGLSAIVDTYGPAFVTFAGEMAKVAGGLAEQFGEMLTTPQWQGLFGEMAELMPVFLEQFGQIMMNLTTGFMELLVAFAPFMAEMGEWLVGATKGFADWAGGLSGSPEFEKFLQYLREAMPEVNKLLSNLGEVFVDLMIGLAPYADELLQKMIDFTGWLAEMEPDEIARLALAFGGLVLAIQALAGALGTIAGVGGLLSGTLRLLGVGGGAKGAAGAAGGKKGGGIWAALGLTGGVSGIVTNLKSVGSGLAGIFGKAGSARLAIGLLGKGLLALLGPVGLAIGIVWLLVDAFRWAYDEVDWFRELVDSSMESVSGAMSVAWTEYIKPVMDKIGAAWIWLRDEIIAPVVAWMRRIWEDNVKPAMEYLYNTAIKPTMDFIGAIFNVVGQVIRTFANAFMQIFKYIVLPAMEWLYDKAIKPVMDFVGEKVEKTWKNVIKPVFVALGGFIEKHVAPVFRKGVELISNIWAGVLDFLRTPIRLGIEYVLNKGLIAGFNWLARKVPGMTELDPIKIPAALQPGGKSASTGRNSGTRKVSMHTGGVLPGYTPGRDVHEFYSPTAGSLHLSGGEGILRPELVQALGASRFNAANAAARSGRVGEGLGFLGGFAKGGILEDLKSGAGNVADALLNPIRWLKNKVKEAIAGQSGIGGFLGDAVGGVIGSIPKSLGNWIKDLVTPDQKKAGATGKGGGGAGGRAGMGVAAMTAALRGIDPSAYVTSGFRGGAMTATGYPSYHGMGRAIDIVSPNMGRTWELLRSAFGMTAAELFYTPKGFLRFGKMGGAAPITRQTHFSHVHLAMNKGGVVPKLYDQGGDLAPGLSLVANKTRKPESIVTNRFTEEVMKMAKRDSGNAPVVDARGAHFGYDPAEVAREIQQSRRDRMALVGTVGGI
jgi:hypothetical protein